MTAMLALLLLAPADSSGPARWPGPPIPAEHLGSPYTFRGSGEEEGLEVEYWQNETLARAETWHKSGGKAWLKVDDRTYVLGFHAAGEWRSDPARRLVRVRGAWRER